MKLIVRALDKRFDILSQSSMLETFIPSLYQYVSLIVKNSYLLPLIQKLENREVEITQKCQDRYLNFLKETEIFPHWKKIKACINIAGKNHNEAAALFLKKQDLSVLDFLHFRAGNTSLRGDSTDKQIQSYQTSAAIVHNYLLEQIESRIRAGFATTRQNQVPAPPNEFIVRMNGRKWSDVSIYIHENRDIRIKFQNGEVHETDWQELGLTKTQENKIVGTVNWDFLYTSAMNGGVFPLQRLSKAEQTKFEQRKCKVKQLLKKKFDTCEDPFNYNPIKRWYQTRFKIFPAPTDRDNLYFNSGIMKDERLRDDIAEQMSNDINRR